MHLVVVPNVLMSGPPGAGKTVLARDLPAILPRVTIEEALDVTHSCRICVTLPTGSPLIRSRPFRTRPHGRRVFQRAAHKRFTTVNLSA